jgi:hypothetical protein
MSLLRAGSMPTQSSGRPALNGARFHSISSGSEVFPTTYEEVGPTEEEPDVTTTSGESSPIGSRFTKETRRGAKRVLEPSAYTKNLSDTKKVSNTLHV